MDGFLDLPLNKSQAKTYIFTADYNNQGSYDSRGLQKWIKPKGINFVYGLLIGAGSGGAGGGLNGGGGGGAAGKRGNDGPAGVCYDRRTYTRGSGCEWCGDCGSPNNPVTVNGVRYNSYGARRIGGCGGRRGCSCAFGYYNGIICRKTELNEARCEVYDPIAKPGGPGGAGGNGGNGRGFEKAPTGGVAGSPGTGSCPTYASRGQEA